MSEVLVLVDFQNGVVKKPTFELLTLAKRLGTPTAVFIGASGDAAVTFSTPSPDTAASDPAVT
jgi:electron transfer flavoprotein alpha subunit